MPAQSATLADDERLVRVELRSKVTGDLTLNGACIDHDQKRVPPEGGDAVRLSSLKNDDGVIVFPIHAKKKFTWIKVHFNATASRDATAGRAVAHGEHDAIVEYSQKVVVANLPDNTLRLTIEAKDERSLLVHATPACTETKECAEATKP